MCPGTAPAECLCVRTLVDVSVHSRFLVRRQLTAASWVRACCRYKRGDLEGKNVSCLMPQPFSSRHNSYLQAYVDTGVCFVVLCCCALLCFVVVLCCTWTQVCALLGMRMLAVAGTRQ